MGVRKDVIKFDTLLQKYIDDQECVRITRNIFGVEESLLGFILTMNSYFMLIQISGDFNLDGYAIIKKNDFKSIRCNKYDKTQKRILESEGILAAELGIKNMISLDSWASIFEDLRKQDFHVSIQDIQKDYLGFEIGPIQKVSNKKVALLSYDPAGKLDKNPTVIKFKSIHIVQFGDRYSTIFRKHLK